MSVSGKFLTATINGVEIRDNYAWDANEGGDVLDRTVGTDLGFENEDMGVENLHITVRGYMSASSGQYIPVRRGTLITNLFLYRRRTDSVPAFAIPLALVVSSRQGGEIRGKVEWNAEIHTKGPGYEYSDPL